MPKKAGSLHPAKSVSLNIDYYFKSKKEKKNKLQDYFRFSFQGFPYLQSEKFFSKNFKNIFKTGLDNRKWNHISYFFTSNQNISFTQCFSRLPIIAKLVLKEGK